MRQRTPAHEGAPDENPRIALVFWDGYLGVAPSLIAAIDELTRNGYSVDVLMRAPPHLIDFPPPPDFDLARTSIMPMPALRVPGVDRSWEKSSWPQRVGLFPRKVAKRAFEHADRLRFRAFVRRHAARRNYVAMIAVDDDAVAAAGPSAQRAGVPLIYWSLELDTLSGGDPLHSLARAYALRVRKAAALTIVQDDARARTLERTGIRPDTIRLVPNAPAGPARPTAGRYFHELFGLPASQRVILHAGVMIPQTCVEEIAAVAASWPESWTLVFHDRAAHDVAVARHLEALGGGRVRISPKPVPYRDVDRIFASADVSLVLYSNQFGENWSLIALASGKLAHSLRAGVPVLCSALPGLAELVESTGCGVAVADLQDSAQGIERILADSTGYRARALACFHEHFDFSVKFRRVLGDLEALVGGHR